MLAATSKFLRQIIPPVIATLIAALLIAGFNRAFSTHLSQPRMAALHAEADAEPAGARTAPALAAPASSVAVALVTEPVRERSSDKSGIREASKDQTKPAELAPVRRAEPRVVEPRIAEPRGAEPRVAEPRVAEIRPTEPRPVERRLAEPYLVPAASAPASIAPAPVAAAPIVVPAAPAARQQELVLAEPPFVTVPDRPRRGPTEATQAEEPPAAPQSHGPIGAIVNTLKPSALLARAREFGEKIEAAGNEILPSIRQ